MAYNTEVSTGIIYRLDCKVNDRVYVGGFFSSTPNDPLLNEKRLAYHAMNAIQGKHKNDLNTDIKNYGTSNFTMEILEVIEDCTASVLRSSERVWVYELADKHGTYLYNKLPKFLINQETPQYEYKYVEGNYVESLNHDLVLSRNLYVLIFDDGRRVEISGHAQYKEYLSTLDTKDYSVRKVLTEDVVDYLNSK